MLSSLSQALTREAVAAKTLVVLTSCDAADQLEPEHGPAFFTV